MYQHRGPDGVMCVYLADINQQCLHCGTRVRSAIPEGVFDSEKPSEVIVPDDTQPKMGEGDIANVSSDRLVEILKERGAEIGEISIGGISGTMILLRRK